MPLPLLVSELLPLERTPEKAVVLSTLNVFMVPLAGAFRFRFPEKERFPVCTVALPNVMMKLLASVESNELEIVRLVPSVLMRAPEETNFRRLVPRALSFPMRIMPPKPREVVPE